MPNIRKYTHKIRRKNKTPNDVAKKHYQSFTSGPAPRNLVTGFIINSHSYTSSKTVTEHVREDRHLNNYHKIIKI